MDSTPLPSNIPVPSTIEELLNLSPDQLEIFRQSTAAMTAMKASVLGSDNVLLQRKLSTRVKQPYYREVYGREMIPILDQLITERKDLQFRVSDFSGYTVGSLYQRIRQSIQFLEDLLDKDNKYKSFKTNYEIQRRTYGVVLAMHKNDIMPLQYHYDSDLHTYEDVMVCINNFLQLPLDSCKEQWPNEKELTRGFKLSAKEIKNIKEHIELHTNCLINVEEEMVKIKKDPSFVKFNT